VQLYRSYFPQSIIIDVGYKTLNDLLADACFQGSVEIRNAGSDAETAAKGDMVVDVKVAADSREKLSDVIVSRAIFDLGSGVVVVLRLVSYDG